MPAWPPCLPCFLCCLLSSSLWQAGQILPAFCHHVFGNLVAQPPLCEIVLLGLCSSSQTANRDLRGGFVIFALRPNHAEPCPSLWWFWQRARALQVFFVSLVFSLLRLPRVCAVAVVIFATATVLPRLAWYFIDDVGYCFNDLKFQE